MVNEVQAAAQQKTGAISGSDRPESRFRVENEIPRGARTPEYRFFEMLPAMLSIGVPVVAVVLSLIDLRAGMGFVMLFIAMTLIRAVRGGVDALRGFRRLKTAESLDWSAILRDTETEIVRARLGIAPTSSAPAIASLPRPFSSALHRFRSDLAADPASFPLPSELLHAVIVAAYNEPYDVIEPSIRSLVRSTIDGQQLVVVFAHEERGGPAMRATVERLQRNFGHEFRAFLAVEHPAGLPDEFPGKGANITWAGRALERWLRGAGIDAERVLVTTLDCDNRVHPRYFDNVSYSFTCAPDRARRSYQPISTFVNNLWHAPAPTRVIAAGNTLWNLISTVRPGTLRNFASHTQPMRALIDMDFWSRRTIVEDGHQYWRSYFHFDGAYEVSAIHVPISQDAVLGETLGRTLRAQFTQLCRWAYGASDIAFVGSRLVAPDRRAPFGRTLWRFITLLDSHVTLATVAPMVAFGAWIPIIVGSLSGGVGTPIAILFREAAGASTSMLDGVSQVLGLPLSAGVPARAASTGSISTPFAHTLVAPPFSVAQFAADLPGLIGGVQRFALVGVCITIVLTLLLTPARPDGVPRRRSLGMLVQWILLPVTLLCYNTMSAIVAQSRLLVGAYREEFDVTEKRAAVPVITGAIPVPVADQSEWR